jgi:hypothetical protein
MARGTRSWIGLLACAASVLAAGVTGCSTLGDARTEEQDRAAQVYEAIVRWFIPASAPDSKTVVFVEPRGEGSVIGLKVQSELIRAVDDVADVRFIDERDEALEKGEDGEPRVRDEGLLLRFGPVPETGSTVGADVDKFVGDETYTSLRFHLVDKGDHWAVVDQPESVTTG